MLPEELYKRRHFGTPQSLLLIVVNYVVAAVAIELFAMCASKISSVFWVVMVLLVFYNYYTIKHNRDEYKRNNIIGYVVSLVVLVLMFFLFRLKAQAC